jgi:hypothetical protein
MYRFYSLLLLRIFALLLLMGMAGIIFFYALGPVVLERIIISRMSSAGLIQPRVKVEAITHESISLSRFSSQKPRIEADYIKVEFSPGGLLQGRVDEIFISGLRYFIVFEDYRPDLGLPESEADQSRAPPVLPFKSLDLSSSNLVLIFPERELLVPVSSKISIRDRQSLVFSVWSQLLGIPLTMEGETNIMTMATTVNAQASLSEFAGPGSGFHGPGAALTGDPPPADLALSLEWSLDPQGKGRGGVDIQAFADDLGLSGPGFGLGLKKGDFFLRAGFDDELNFEQFDADLSLAGLKFNDNYLERLNLSVREAGSGAEFSARLNQPMDVLFKGGGKQSSVNELLKNGFEYFADFEWEIACVLDQDQAAVLSPVKVMMPDPLRTSASGRVRADFSAGSKSGDDNWSVRVTGEKAGVSVSSMSLPEYGLGIKGLDFSAPFFVEAGPGSIRAGLMGKSRLRVRETNVEQNLERYLVSGLDLTNQQGKPALLYRKKSADFSSLSFNLEQKGMFEAGLTKADLLVQGLKISGDIGLDSRGISKAEIMISPEISMFRLHDPGVEIRDINFDLPFILGDLEAKPGNFSTGTISYSDMDFPGMSGWVFIDNYKTAVEGEWLFLPGGKLDFSADVMMDPGKDPAGKVSAHTNWFDFPEKEMMDDLVPALKDMTITGSARARLDLDLRGQDMTPFFRADIRNVDAKNRDLDMEVSELSGSVVIDDFFPLTTPGNQRIDITKFRIGPLELVDGFLTFRLESPDSVFLEKTRWSLPEGGFIAAHASRFDLNDQSADFEIFFEDVDLLQLVSRLSEEKIVGSGLVYGRIPIVYQKERVTINQGYLYSVPGKGRLGIRDEEWLEILLLYVRDAMKGHPYLSLVSKRLEQALRDFEYDFLAVNLVPGLEDTAARIEIRGQGVEGDPPQEVGSLVINVNDLGEIVNRVLRFQLTRDESIERALDELFDF